MVKRIVENKGRLETVAMPKLHKINQSKIIGICSHCLERSIFRIVAVNKINKLACTRCLKSDWYYKNQPLKSNPMFFREAMSIDYRAIRLYKRAISFIKGNHVYFPFKIKRKSNLGLKITKYLISRGKNATS